jgi:hypothetical protein
MRVRSHNHATNHASRQLRVAGDAKVRANELAVARAAVAKLPAADRALLAKRGLHLELVGTKSLEDAMWGATSVERDSAGRLAPTRIRVASHIRGTGANSLAEVVQHELGHAISVIRSQDSSEDAAAAYARAH